MVNAFNENENACNENENANELNIVFYKPTDSEGFEKFILPYYLMNLDEWSAFLMATDKTQKPFWDKVLQESYKFYKIKTGGKKERRKERGREGRREGGKKKERKKNKKTKVRTSKKNRTCWITSRGKCHFLFFSSGFPNCTCH